MVDSKINLDKPKLVEMDSYNINLYNKILDKEHEKKMKIEEEYEKFDPENDEMYRQQSYECHDVKAPEIKAGLKNRLHQNSIIIRGLDPKK